MRTSDVYILAADVTSGVGDGLAANYAAARACATAVRAERSGDVACSVARIPDNGARAGGSTRLESLLITVIDRAIAQSGIDPTDPRTILVIASAKGNIDLLDAAGTAPRLLQSAMSHYIATHFGSPGQPLTICIACISGSAALLAARDMIRSGNYDHAIVAGGDIITDFTLTGFIALKAMAPDPCRPFDVGRQGLSLGEAAGCIVLGNRPAGSAGVRIAGGATSNDANHITGPSRTGEGLRRAIMSALEEAGIRPDDVDSVSAHGTATVYNDEMEALALYDSGILDAPVFSLKGIWGHTLGAAGIIESALAVRAMEDSLLLPSCGFTLSGVSVPITILSAPESGRNRICLKTASGFGGCNAAVVFAQ